MKLKKTLISLILFSLIIGNAAYAEYSFVDSSDFTGDAFFTPPALQEKQQEAARQTNDTGVKHSVPPLKKLRLKIKKKLDERHAKKYELAPTAPQEDDVYAAGTETSEYASQEIKDDFDETMMPDGFEADQESVEDNKKVKKHFWQRKPKKSQAEIQEEEDNIILDCENVDYDTDNYCVVANGDAVITFVKQDTTVKADKITYDRMNNTIKAEGNVRIIKNGQTINGEYIFVDLNEENALIEKPIAQTATVSIKSDKGYVYGDRIIQEQGELTVDKSFPINFRSINTGPRVYQMIVPEEETLSSDMEKGRIALKAKSIKISQKGDLIVADLKKAALFRGDKRIIKLPPAKIYTNKNFDFAETASWELGSIRGLGMYLGPGHVFEIPGGSVLKVMPILNYNHGFGIGGIARYSSASNWTQAAYGTADSKFLIRGRQKLDDHLSLQYVMNDYSREWFLGRRRAKYGASIVYENGYAKEGFLLKNQMSSFAHQFDFGYFQDIDEDSSYKELGGSELGTTRTRYMAQVNQNFYSYKNEDKQTVFTLGIVGQLSAALYGTGDTQVIGRIGPNMHIQYKRWMQDIGYFHSAYEDNTPMPVYDSYRYGKSNIYVREYIRLNKYLTLSWFGSMNISNDSPNDKMFQENAFFISVGPDDIKFSIGYDFIRENTRFMVEVMMDTKGTKVEYDRLEIKQDKKSQKKSEDYSEEPEKDFQQPQKAPVLQHAVVEDVKNMEDVL